MNKNDLEADAPEKAVADGDRGDDHDELEQVALNETKEDAPESDAAGSHDGTASEVEPEDPVLAAILRGDFETGYSLESILEEITATPPLKRTEVALTYDIVRFAAIMPEPCVCLARLKVGLQTLGVKVRDWTPVVRQLRSQIEQERKLEEQAEREANDDRPTIILTPLDEFEVNERIVEVLAMFPNLYQRMGQLVTVSDEPRQRPGYSEELTTTQIRVMSESVLREYFTRAARWLEEATNDDGEPVLRRTHPPEWSYKAVHKWQTWPGMKHLFFVTDAPVLLNDAAILSGDTYDAKRGILCRPKITLPPMPEHPTQADVRRSAEKLLDVASDFPFQAPAHRSAWIAALLTPIARWAFKDQAPFFMFDANQSGSGKGLLLKVIGWIALGHEMDLVVQTSDEEEERKRITSKVLRGGTMLLIDDIDKPFGSSSLDSLLTTGIWGERLLGSNDAPSLDVWLTWYGSGNNVVYKRDDTRRRSCVIRLCTDLPRPEQRRGYKRPNLQAYVLEHRGELFAAALTILRGWLLAHQDPAELPGWGGPFGSFDDWDRVVRGAIVYAGLVDPIEAKATAETLETEGDGLRLLLRGMEEAATEFEGPVTSNAIVEALKENDEWRRADRATSPSWRRDDKATPLRLVTLRKALTILLPRLRPGELPNHYQIGNLLARYRDRPIATEAGIKRLVFRELHGNNRWFVERVPTRSNEGTEATAQPYLAHGVSPGPAASGDASAACERCAGSLDPACGLCTRCSGAQGGCRCGECLERLGTGEYQQTGPCNLCGNTKCRCRHCGCCTQLDMMRGGCCC